MTPTGQGSVHGGMLSAHERPAVWMVPEQQAADPPGRPLRPVPLHVPQP
jgi:hypothetical protein